MTHTPPALRAALVLACLTAACARTDATPAAGTRPAAASAGGDIAVSGASTARKAPTDSISTAADRGRIRGSDTARVWLIEVSDFQCPYCKQWHDQSFAVLDKEYVQTGKVRLAYINFPLSSIHPNARAAAEAAMCASVQNKFWPVHEALYATQEKWAAAANPIPAFDSLAVAAGVNAPAWRSCMTSHATAPLIDADQDRSKTAGARSTPTFFIGDRTLEGAYPADSFRVAIDAALAKARGAR
ncbi:MAG TPA: thioredoxin domain-containing protein [Gemmatimonadaceae bacterium]